MSDNFDYRKDFIQFEELLPEYFQNDINVSTFSTGVNRFLTADDYVYVQGKIGKQLDKQITNPAPTDVNIPEDSLSRRTWQLQPLIYSKLGTKEYITSFQDVLNKLTRLGVDVDRQDKWIECDQFNFAPPIDVDKFVNYRDYFWVENSHPNYITMNNDVTRAKSLIFEIEAGTETSTKQASLDDATAVRDEKQAEIDYALNKARDYERVITPKYQWINDNKWVHRSELVGYNYAFQAKLPIIEYFSNLEVNSWTYTKHNWKYRATEASDWVSVPNGPTEEELHQKFPIIEITKHTFVVKGDVVKFFGKSFTVVDSSSNDGAHNIDTIVYDKVTDKTTITTKNYHSVTPGVYVDVFNNTEYYGVTGNYYGVITPYLKTQFGDNWKGLFVHWLLDSVEPSVPVNSQNGNYLQKTFTYTIPNFGYDVQYYDGLNSDVQYGYDGQARLTFPVTYMIDTDDIQVYLNGVRQYGTYTESINVDNRSHFDADPYNSSRFDSPRHPKQVLSNCINFIKPLTAGDHIVIKVGAACVDDYQNYVAVVKYKDLFGNTNIGVKNLTQYRLHEQVKVHPNQYIQFDIYNVDGTTNYSANELFKYYEDLSADVNGDIGLRINTVHNDYQFNNLLVNGTKLLCYKEYDDGEVLNTVWRKCGTKYTPKKVNVYRQADTNGEWELPEPLRNNIIHECRADLSFRELFTHFKSITTKQTFSKSYVTSDRVCKLLTKLDYSGGNIKEHNGNFDYLISAMHQDVYSYPEIIKFAKNKYAENLHDLKQICINKTAFYARVNASLTHELAIQTIAEHTVTDLINNLLLDVTYFDSTSFKDGIGVRNWIATLPILGLYPSYEPMLLVDSKLSLNSIRHHDGHLSTPSISTDEFNILKNTFVFSDGIVTGNFRYDNASNTIQRCYVRFSQQSQPTVANNGDLWYDTTFNVLMQYTGSSWTQVQESLAWSTFDVTKVINTSIMLIERKLYDRAKLSSVKINYASIIGSDSSLFIDYMKDRYLTYLKSIGELVLPMEFIDGNPFTWNYMGIDSPLFSNGSPQITIQYQRSQTWAAYWWQIYELQYGTPYPHLEPWKLQGYPEKPVQWDNVYAALPNSGMRWKPSMWTNIRAGVIDSSLPYPPNAPPKYTIISVNTTGTTQGVYAPDDLVPPRVSNANLVAICSLVQFNDPTVVRPNSVSYPQQFGLQGLQERQWRTSIDYSYDVLLALFRLQPIKTIQATFGNDFYDINGLVVDSVTQNVPSYKTTIFHGTSYNNNTYLINGVNQWYINALRSDNNKTGIDDFKALWSTWTPKLTYQTNSVIKEDSLLVDNKLFVLNKNDYQLHMKRTPGAFTQWLHSLRISLYKYGSYSTDTYGTKLPSADDWQFRVDTLVPEGSDLKYYDVRTYSINSVDVNTNTFYINKPSLVPWTVDNNVRIKYTGIIFNPANVYKAVPVLDANKQPTNHFSLLSYDQLRSEFVPVDLYDTVKCYCYSNTVPSVGYTFDSTTGNITEHTATSTNIVVLKDYDLKYDLTTNTLMQYRILSGKWLSVAANTFVLPIIHDYIYLYDELGKLVKGVDYTVDAQFKTITLLKHVKSLSVLIAIPNDTVIEERAESFTVATTKGKVTWNHIQIDKNSAVKSIQAPAVVTGIQGVINFIDGYSSYLMDSGFAFNDYSRPLEDPNGGLLNWQNEIEKFVAKVYVGFNQRYDQAYNLATNSVAIYDYIDLNPFKYEFWIETTHGIVSNIMKGPYKDIATSPIVYDKSGKAIDSMDDLKIYRTDKETHVAYNINSKNYIGGMNMFVDYYEHVIMFNDYTTNNNLVYDSFLGLNNEQLHIAFNKHFETSKRPNIGGGFLTNGTIVDNIESSAKTFSELYDIRANESSKHITESRYLLGYDNEPYLNSLTSKSKFLFWNGMIHHKGTNNSVQRFVKVASGENIELDEIWMYKIDAYGHNDKLREMYINIFPTDVVNDKIMYQLTSSTPDTYFTAIKNDDVTRWKLLPDIDNTNIFDLNVIGTVRYVINGYAKLSTPPNGIIYDTLKLSYMSLPQLCDDVDIYVEKSYDLVLDITKPYNSIVGASENLVVVSDYVMGTNMLTVSINGIILPVHEYQEISSTQIMIPTLNRYKKAIVTVMYGRGKLVQNKHYEIRSNDLVMLLATNNIDWTSVDCFDIDMKRIDTDNTTLKLIDTVNNIVVASSEIYNPAYGIQHASVKDVNYIRTDDPANYMDNYWGEEHTSEKWVDTTHLNYVPYYDNGIYTNVFDQVESWGKTSIWSKLTCYEWIASDIPPYKWNDNLGEFNTAGNRTYIGKPLTVLQKGVRASIYDTFTDWYDEVTTYQYINAFEYSSVSVDNSLTFTVTLSIDPNNDSFGVYVNGVKNRDYLYTSKTDDLLGTLVLDTVTVPNVTDKDKIVLIRFADVPDLTRAVTDNDLVRYQETYKYNVVSKYDITGSSISNTYYFWASNQITRTNSTMPLAINYTRGGDGFASKFGFANDAIHTGYELSTIDIERGFVENSNMYTIVLPNGKIVIKNINKTIINNDYAVQIIKNSALTVHSKTPDVNVHERYTEWKTLRKNSVDRVPVELWSKIIETIAGRTVTGDPIPSYSRILFDTANNEYTRFGISPGQAMGPKDEVLNSIIDLINTDDFDILPVDKDEFVNTYNFNDYSNIVKTMNYIYDNFNVNNVNEIFFTVLQILYTSNSKVEGIVKTSMVALDCSLTFKTE